MGGSDRHKQRERERAEEAGGVEGRHRKEKRGKRDKSSSGREDRDKRSKEKREKKSRKEKRTAGEKEKKQKHHKRRKTQDEPISSEDESSESSASGGAGPLPESAARGGSIANSAMLSPPSSGLRKADTQSVERMLRSGSVSAEELRGLLGLLDAGEAVLLPIETDSVSRDRLGELSFALGLQREMLDDGTIAYSAHSDAALLLPQVEHLLDISADQLVTCAAAAAVDADTTDAIGAVGAVETIGPAGPPVRAQPAGEDGHGIAADASVSEQSASSKRVLGPTLPSSLEDALEQSAREAAELQARGDNDDGGGEDGVVGPVLPTDLVLANAACDEGVLWWQRGDAAPKPRADEVEKEEEPQARESWMTALPTGRSGVSAVLGESRQFARKDVSSGELDAKWSETPQSTAMVQKLAEQPKRPMSLAEAAAFARANAGNRRSAPSARETRAPKDDADASKPKPKSLVEISAELRDKKKKESNAKSEWEATHPWRPWNRDTDLDVRLTKPKDKETILNNQHLGTLGNRFGGGRRETSFI